MTKEIKKLPVASDISICSFEYAVSLLEKPKFLDKYILLIDPEDLIYAMKVWEIVIKEQKLSGNTMLVEEMPHYKGGEWTLHLVRNNKEIDVIHSEGA